MSCGPHVGGAAAGARWSASKSPSAGAEAASNHTPEEPTSSGRFRRSDAVITPANV